MGKGAGKELQDTEAALDDAATESKGDVLVPMIIDPDPSLSLLSLLEPIA